MGETGTIFDQTPCGRFFNRSSDVRPEFVPLYNKSSHFKPHLLGLK